MGGLVEEERKRLLKEVIRQLHAGVSPQEVKGKFKQVLEGVSLLEIAKIEQELIEEGVSREEIQRLCDVHLALFREQLQKQQVETAPENPIGILRGEHEALQQLLEKLAASVAKIQKAEDLSSVSDEIPRLTQIAEDFLDAEKHYLREENVLFPVLEKHGITEPPAIMWMEHNQLREKKKQLYSLIENHEKIDFQDFKKQLSEIASSISNTLSSHIFKENNILFQLALRVVTEQEWQGIRGEFDEIGYCCFTPSQLITRPKAVAVEKPQIEETAMPEGVLRFETGSLSKEEMEAILNTLPVDITFVDKDDAVKYFNKAEKRIFVRTKAVIGRKVQLCHPQKSVHVVNKILEAFKKGEKDVAEFWIQAGGRLVHIRYFAVRDRNDKYLGTMEVTQDITDLKKIEGEKRLLDWEG
jgi:PAS domain S-box-containing protein